MLFLLLHCFSAVLGTNMHLVNICCLSECNMLLCEKLEVTKYMYIMIEIWW